jgi:hypothetical protein
MNAAHLHVILNHIPIVGVPIGFALLLFGLVRGSSEVKSAALLVFIAMGIIAVPTFLAGKAAEDIVEHLPGVTEAAIEKHETAATIALGLSVALAALAFGVLLWSFRTAGVGSAAALLLLLISGGVSGWLAWTGNLGGKVRHTEFREGAFAEGEEGERTEEEGGDRGRRRRGRGR